MIVRHVSICAMTSLTMYLNRHPDGQLCKMLFSSASDLSESGFIQIAAKHPVLNENPPTSNAMLSKATCFVIRAGRINVL